MNPKPNLILIQVDQWRGDCLSLDGHPVVHTPWLDQLALGGVRFSRAYSSCPSCIPARAALMTGLGQRSHGRVGYRDGLPWNYEVTLAGEFTRHGYQSQAIGKMHVYPERSQLGFQNVILHDGFLHHTRRTHHDNPEAVDDYLVWLRRQTGRPDADYFDHGVGCNASVARPWPMEEALHPTNWVATEALDFLRRRRDPRKPVFLYLSFHRPHPPYDPPQWAFEQYLHEPMPPPPVGAWANELAGYGNGTPSSCYAELSPRLLQRARAGYYGHMTHIDHQINRLLEVLDTFDRSRETWVCFTSDHGEMMGDHHLFRKSLPYEGSARVPLLLKGPKNAGLLKGAVCPEVVEARDIMPTLLDCAGLPVPASVEGRSLLPLARGTGGPVRPYLHGEHVALGQSLQWLTDGRQKYVWFSGTGREQLFDLDADPTELCDLSAQAGAQEALAGWRSRLVRELAGCEEGFSDGARLHPGRPVSPVLAPALQG